MDSLWKFAACLAILFLTFIFGGAFGYGSKEKQFVDNIDSGMIPYVSPLGKLEWRPR